MLAFIIKNLNNTSNSELKDLLGGILTDVRAQEYTKYNPNTDKFEIQDFKVYRKLSNVLENNGFNEPKRVENTDIFLQIDSYKISFWLE